MTESHSERIERMRAAYREAHARFVKRLTGWGVDSFRAARSSRA